MTGGEEVKSNLGDKKVISLQELEAVTAGMRPKPDVQKAREAQERFDKLKKEEPPKSDEPTEKLT